MSYCPALQLPTFARQVEAFEPDHVSVGQSGRAITDELGEQSRARRAITSAATSNTREARHAPPPLPNQLGVPPNTPPDREYQAGRQGNGGKDDGEVSKMA